MLTREEAEILSKARNILKEKKAWDRHEKSWQVGFVAGHADVAEDAIFNYLNTASSYLDDKEADWAIEEHLRR